MKISDLVLCEIYSCRLSRRACAMRWAKSLDACESCAEGKRRAATEGLEREVKKGKGYE